MSRFFDRSGRWFTFGRRLTVAFPHCRMVRPVFTHRPGAVVGVNLYFATVWWHLSRGEWS